MEVHFSYILHVAGLCSIL